MQVINDVECESANDLKTILKANNKETPIGSSMGQLHMMPRLSQIERAQVIGVVRAFQWQVAHHFCDS